MNKSNQYQITFTGEETFDELTASAEKLADFNHQRKWIAGDLFNEMIRRFPDQSKVITSNPKSMAIANTCASYPESERVYGVLFDIHAYLRDKDDRHKQLILAHQSGHTLKDVKDRNSEQLDTDIGKGKRLTTKHKLMLETIATKHDKSIDIDGHEFKFNTLKGVETAEKAIKLAVETALKGR